MDRRASVRGRSLARLWGQWLPGADAALMAYFVVQRAAINVFTVLATTLYLSHAGAHRLPMMYIVLNIAAIMLQLWIASRPRLSSYRMLARLSLLLCTAVALSPFLVAGAGKGAIVLVVLALAVASRLWEILSGTLFLNVVNEVYPLREAKERLPGFLTGASVGVIVSGYLVRPMMSAFPIEAALVITAVLFALDHVMLIRVGQVLKRLRAGRQAGGGSAGASVEDAAALVAADPQSEPGASRPARRWAGAPVARPVRQARGTQGHAPREGEGAGRRTDTGPSPDTRGEGRVPSSAQSSGSGLLDPGILLRMRVRFRRLLGGELVANLAVVGFLVALLRFLLDFQYASAISHRFPDQREMASFLGTYEASLTVLILINQAFGTRAILRRLKLGVVVALLPGAMVMTYGLAALWPTFVVVMATRLISTVLSNGYYNPGANLLVGPLEPAARDRARLVVSTITSMGCLLSGLLLQAGLRDLTPSQCFWLQACIALVALFICRRLDRAYLRVLRRELGQKDVRRRLENLRALRVVSHDYAAERIMDLLEDEDATVRERALDEVQFLGAVPARRVLERVLVKGADPRLRATALRETVGVLGLGALGVARPYLQDPDRRVEANALEAIAAIGGPQVEPILEPYLDSPDHRLRVTAVVGLVRSSEREEVLERSLTTLAAMAHSTDALVRASAAYGLGDLGMPFLAPAAVRLAGDPVDQVFDRALEALGEIQSPEAVPLLADLAQKPAMASRREKLQDHCRQMEDHTASDLIAVMETLSAEERARWRERLGRTARGERARVLSLAMSLGSARARAGVVAFLHAAPTGIGPAIIRACMDTAGGQPTLLPILDAMRQDHYRGERLAARLITGLLDESTAVEIRAYLDSVWARVRAVMRLGQQYSEESPEAECLARRRSGLLSNGFALVGLESARPRDVVEALEKALEGDRFVASLSMEFVAAQIDPATAACLLPLLEEIRNGNPAPERSDPTALAQEARLLATAMARDDLDLPPSALEPDEAHATDGVGILTPGEPDPDTPGRPVAVWGGGEPDGGDAGATRRPTGARLPEVPPDARGGGGR